MTTLQNDIRSDKIEWNKQIIQAKMNFCHRVSEVQEGKHIVICFAAI